MSDEAWYIVRNTPGVTGFIGSSGKGAKPTPYNCCHSIFKYFLFTWPFYFRKLVSNTSILQKHTLEVEIN